MVWLLEDSDEGCTVAKVEVEIEIEVGCAAAGKMFDCLYLTKLGIAGISLTGSADCCVDSFMH